MSSKVKKLLNSLKNINIDKKKDIYKYDDLINEKIKLLNKNVKQKKKYKIGKYTVNRKIPDNEELKIVYNNFIKNNNIKIKEHKLFYYNHNIESLNLSNDNQYILLNLNLNKYKNYLLSISFDTKQELNVSFLLGNNVQIKEFKLDNKLSGNIMFNTNILNQDNKYLSFMYIIFKKKEYIKLKNIILNINEIKNKLNYDITLIKCNNYVKIFN